MTIDRAYVTFRGQTYNMDPTGDGYYSVSLTAPTQSSGSNNNGSGPGIGSEAQGTGYYPIIITAVDDSGNTTTIDVTDSEFGNALKLKVLETTKPTAAISFPTAGAFITNAKPTIKFTLTDSGSGINPAAVFIKVDDGSAVAVTPTISGTTATCEYIPSTALSEGDHTITVYGSDYDGNQSDSVSVTFRIDTVAPTLNITAPVDGLKTNQASVTVTGTTNDTTSSPVTIQITAAGKTYNPTVTGGAFSQVVTLNSGSNTITIVATDAAGMTTTVTRTVILNTSAPVFMEVETTPNPVNVGASLSIRVRITDE